MVNVMVNNKLDIVIALIEKPNERITINRLSQELDMDYKNLYNIVKNFERANLIFLEKNGNAYNCILNKKVHPIIFEAEFKRRNNFLKEKSFKVLNNKLSKLNFPFIALVFGSYAKGTETKNSDIDLMVICENSRNKEIQRTISLFPQDIHLITLTSEEFHSMANSKEFNVVTEAISNNIILIGIEDYYRMLENVG